MKNIKVLIVGAGPTGLTAGVELARRGIKSEIIDKKTEQSKLSRAIGINPRSLEILTPSGVTEQLLAKGVAIKSAYLYRGTKEWVKLTFNASPVKYGYSMMLGLPQNDTESILSETYKKLGGIIHLGTELSDVTQTENEVIAITKDGKEFRADYLIGADGIKSQTRTSVGIESEGEDLVGYWSIADVEVEDWKQKNSAIFYLLDKGEIATILPLGGKRYRIFSNTEDTLTTFPLEINILEIHRKGEFRIRLSMVNEFSKGRVYLAGDAAHSHSPAGGRGMNLGIADAADLVSRIAGEDSLDTYSQDRLLEDKKIIEGAEQMRRILTSPSRLKRFVVLVALKCISNSSYLQKKWTNNFLYAD